MCLFPPHLLAKAPSELRRLAEPASCEFVSCLRHPQALESVGPALVDWLLALEGDQRGDRERPTSRKHVAEALCVLLRGSLCVFQPTGRITDHACAMLGTVFRAAAFASEKETFAVALGKRTGVKDVAQAASSMIAQLAPAWSRVRRSDGEAAARLAALCALAAAVCSIDATQLRAALVSLQAACPGQATHGGTKTNFLDSKDEKAVRSLCGGPFPAHLGLILGYLGPSLALLGGSRRAP